MKSEEKRALVREVIWRTRKCKDMTQYLEKFTNSKKSFDLQPLPDLLVVTGNDSDRTYDSSTASGPNVMGYINSLQERVQALEDKLQRIEKAFKGDNE